MYRLGWNFRQTRYFGWANSPRDWGREVKGGGTKFNTGRVSFVCIVTGFTALVYREPPSSFLSLRPGLDLKFSLITTTHL